MKLDNIYKKILELKFKAQTENVKLEIQKLAQLADIKKEEKNDSK
jgi:hypothetical protein